MKVTEHQRPGVYSVYDASSAVRGNRGGRAVGLVGVCDKLTAGKAEHFGSCQQAESRLGAGEPMTELIRVLFSNGAGQVWAVAAEDEAGYEAAFAALEKVEDLAAVVCDSGEERVQQKLRDSVKNASANRRERLAVVFGSEGETVETLV